MHLEFFACVANIYKVAKEAHGIQGAVLVILVEDETKVKGRVIWDPRSDTLVRFCGCKVDHKCI